MGAKRLREHGLSATRPRIDVLAALEDLGEHRSADEVRDRVTAGGHRMPVGLENSVRRFSWDFV
jgi:Fe2+ or Zn2+ uptake regulation protein